MSLVYSEVLMLSLEELYNMKVEFPAIYKLMIESAERNFAKDIEKKIQCIKHLEIHLIHQGSGNAFQ